MHENGAIRDVTKGEDTDRKRGLTGHNIRFGLLCITVCLCVCEVDDAEVVVTCVFVCVC